MEKAKESGQVSLKEVTWIKLRPKAAEIGAGPKSSTITYKILKEFRE